MFGSSYCEFVQGSALRTWNCVAHFASLVWYKFNHLRDPIMPRSRRRHHSRSRSRSRSHSHERDREPKRRKIESYDSPHHRRSVSSEPEVMECEIDDHEVDEPDVQRETDLLISLNVTENRLDNKNKSKSKNIRNTLKNKDDNDKSHIAENLEFNVLDKEEKFELSDDMKIASLSTDDDKSVSNIKNKSFSSNNQVKGTDMSQVPTQHVQNANEEATINKNHALQFEENKVSGKDMDVINNSDKEIIKNASPNKFKDKINDVTVTPKKVLSPKQLERKLESEKKRQDKQKEKEGRERKRLEEKEEKERKKIEEKNRMTAEKLRLKQEKEEQKIKEKIAKEQRKKKEQEERDKKRREKEEKEEQKKKEREQEKLKKQQEIEEKNKEKQKLEEQKQKTAAAFANFFLSKKSDLGEEKKIEETSKFMPFEVKSDMRLAPVLRKYFTDDEKLNFDEKLKQQNTVPTELYLEELKQGKAVGKSKKTWPFEDVDQDDSIIIVEENLGETIVEQKLKLEKMRAKFLKFSENQRPPYFGTFKKRSKTVGARKPFNKDALFNYEINSDEEWEEEGEGESLKGTDDEDEKDNESDNDYEVDNEFFVPHGHLSDDEVDDEENAKLSPESHKAKLKVLKSEFDEEMKSKTQKIKPRVIGCIWYNKDKTNVEEAIDRYLQPFSIVCNGPIEIKKRTIFALASLRKTSKQLSKEHVPLLLKLIHGSVDKRKNIIKMFLEHMNNNGVQLEISQLSLGRQFKNFAQWQKCPEDGAMHNKMCWYVGEDVRKKYNVTLTLPNKSNTKRNSKTK